MQREQTEIERRRKFHFLTTCAVVLVLADRSYSHVRRRDERENECALRSPGIKLQRGGWMLGSCSMECLTGTKYYDSLTGRPPLQAAVGGEDQSACAFACQEPRRRYSSSVQDSARYVPLCLSIPPRCLLHRCYTANVVLPVMIVSTPSSKDQQFSINLSYYSPLLFFLALHSKADVLWM